MYYGKIGCNVEIWPTEGGLHCLSSGSKVDATTLKVKMCGVIKNARNKCSVFVLYR